MKVGGYSEKSIMMMTIKMRTVVGTNQCIIMDYLPLFSLGIKHFGIFYLNFLDK